MFIVRVIVLCLQIIVSQEEVVQSINARHDGSNKLALL
jgi:hypothetical protein